MASALTARANDKRISKGKALKFVVVAGVNLPSTTRGKDKMKLPPRLTFLVTQSEDSSDEEMTNSKDEMSSDEDEELVPTIAVI